MELSAVSQRVRKSGTVRDVTGRGDGGGPDDQLIQAHIQKLPTAGPWPADERVNWRKLLDMTFQIAYGPVESIEIKKEAANCGGLS